MASLALFEESRPDAAQVEVTSGLPQINGNAALFAWWFRVGAATMTGMRKYHELSTIIHYLHVLTCAHNMFVWVRMD